MNMKYKTELVQPTGPEMRQGYAVLLYALTCVLRALFTGVGYAHDVWQKHLLHEKAERRGSQDSTAAHHLRITHN